MFQVYGSGSLSDLKEIGCRSVWLVHISPLSVHGGHRTTIGFQKLSSPGHFFTSIL